VTGQVEYAISTGFWRSLQALSTAEAGQVTKAVARLTANPRHPGLHLELIRRNGVAVYTARASDDLRILLVREGDVFLLERAGHHDDIYRVAERLRFVYNAGTGVMRIVEVGATAQPGDAPDRADRNAEAGGATGPPAPTPPAASPPTPTPPAPTPPAVAERGVFDHWADHELAAAGVAPAYLPVIRAWRSEDDLLAAELPEPVTELLIDLLATTPEQWRAPTIRWSVDAPLALPGEPLSPGGDRLRRSIAEHGAALGLSPLLGPDDVAKLLAAPIEEWMVFLHPEQRTVIDRRYDGPARVRGSAGTGKTVVALHRAAALVARARADAQPVRPVLFTTYITSLVPVLARLYQRLPGTRPDDPIDFVGIDRLARRLCEEAGDHLRVDVARIDRAFRTAWQDVVRRDTPLFRLGLTRGYVRDEITRVIKGRGLMDRDEYLAVERTGRRIPLPAPARAQIWALREAWDARMAELGTLDFADVLLRALGHARRRPEPTYRAAIVDEAQDLTLTGLRLVCALVFGPGGVCPPDGLFIVGDGAQRVYPGGYTLRQAGLETRGRTAVLRRNYRNRREIIEAAMAVAGAEPVDDLEETYRRADAVHEAVRAGGAPVLVHAADPDREVGLLTEVVKLVATPLGEEQAAAYGDLCVAVATNRQVERVLAALAAAGVPAMRLEDYDGTPIERVKVGTHFRAKGLEFKVVLLPFLGVDDFPGRDPGAGPAEAEERRELAVSQLFVAMTRARDALILTCTGEPSPILARGGDRLTRLPAAQGQPSA
jgi:hypothetical protein